METATMSVEDVVITLYNLGVTPDEYRAIFGALYAIDESHLKDKEETRRAAIDEVLGQE